MNQTIHCFNQVPIFFWVLNHTSDFESDSGIFYLSTFSHLGDPNRIRILVLMLTPKQHGSATNEETTNHDTLYACTFPSQNPKPRID